ncbi:MAG TPA: IS4 family transposase, partial [Streptosporangiaceae bacterium]|nr:IS4 family transposase [Streptosporangiaceae bacterium]
ALFMDRGALRVMRKLAGVVAWAERGVTVSVPSEEALSNARARLGSEPLRLLFEKVAGPVAMPGAAGAWWRGLRLVSLDGTTLDAQDEQANWQRFGGPSTRTPEGKRLRGAFPQVRLLALAECGTRALIAAAHGAFSTGEKTLARDLIGKLGEGMVCLADRNFACWELWRDAAATGAALLWRIGASFSLPVDDVLGDGTYLSRLKAPRRLRKDGAEDITVRVIEYRLEDEDGNVTETFTLITTLLDPDAAPARELAELYRARWEIETALGSLKTQMKGAGIVLRSKTPDGVVQEVWALLCAYQAVRELISAAAALAAEDPLRICFVNALDIVRGPVGTPGSFPPSPG